MIYEAHGSRVSYLGFRFRVSAQPLACGGGQFDRQKKLMNIEH
jgi:hypothetical protein